MRYSPHQLAFFAHQLTRRAASNSMDAMAGALLDAQVDLNPHQIDAAMFATSNPLSKGVILADEVGLGKTIEAGLLIAQRWAERRRRILVITPANLRKQWHQELADKFGLPANILEAKSYRHAQKNGVENPFDVAGITICSYQFAAGKDKTVQAVAWDLVVIDEAHRLRNVHKPENKTARALRDALAHPQKVLLTATPLQNSLLELYGLVSFVDERVFGDLESFKTQFATLKNAESFDALKLRIAPICKRTLRRQVEAYVKYTKRIPLLQEFTPGANETQLYHSVSEYLSRDALYALPNSQRQLITLVLRKLLASSTYAIAGALETLTNRLRKTLDEKTASQVDAETPLVDVLDEDYEALDEIADEMGESEPEKERARTQAEALAIGQEIAELESFRKLAISITENAKGTALLQALRVAFGKLDELNAPKKAIIFTESRRTQDYLMNLLANTPYGPGVVLFNGSNTDPLSKRIYSDWLERHTGTDQVSGSRTADTRAALVEHFKLFEGKGGSIMIATEAGAEGINLQFCSLVINYDLPWNPQRIEQRIGRCHRYGQKHDVVVVNFLNRENEADKRVYELLDQKFKLFDGVFGASDEVLGVVESGVDFERRIADIYQTCRQTTQIHAAFEQLQLDLAGEISDAMLKARKALLENFDEDVQERLRLRSQESKASLGKLERLLMRFTRAALDGHAKFSDDDTSFVLQSLPPSLQDGSHVPSDFPLGRYELPRRSDEAHIFRLGHPLAQTLLASAKQLDLMPATLVLDYDAYGTKVSVIEQLLQRKGQLEVHCLEIRSLGVVEEHLLIAACDDDGNAFDRNIAERLLGMPCKSSKPLPTGASRSATKSHENLTVEIDRQKSTIFADLEMRNMAAFSQESEKLDAWADDLKVGLEREIKELDRRIKEVRTKSKGAATLADKLAAQKEQRDLEGHRDKKRRELFDRQDEIQQKRDDLIEELELQLKQEIAVRPVLAFNWELQ